MPAYSRLSQTSGKMMSKNNVEKCYRKMMLVIAVEKDNCSR